MLVKDTNYGLQALWDYVRKLGPLDKPKREWVGLEEKEVMDLYMFWVVDLQDIMGFYIAIARKLEDRNT